MSEQEAQQETQQDTKEVASKAASMGHIPKDQWKGDPAKWRPAEEFVERGENIIPIMKKQMDQLRKDLEMSLKVNNKELEAVRKQVHDQEKAKYEAKLAEIEGKMEEAVDIADKDTYKELKKERDSIKPPAEPEKPKQADNVEFIQWSEKNAWYQEDNLLKRNADMIAGELVAADPTLGGKALYEKVEAQIKKDFDFKFTNPARENAISVESGDSTPAAKKGTFADLPSEAKATFKRLKAQAEAKGRTYTEAAYLAAYNE